MQLRLIRGGLSIGLLLVIIANLLPAQQVFAICAINGNVFRDFDADGVDDGTLEPGMQGIQAIAYDATGTAIAADGTDAFGDYTLTVPDNTDVRVEFSIPGTQAFLQNGAAGAGSATSVTFVDCGVGSVINNINYGVNNPAHYCESDPQLMTSCYVFGAFDAPTTTNLANVITFSYNGLTTNLAANSAAATVAETLEATSGQVGAVWGKAYQPASDSIFASAFIKRHVSLGPTGNPGTIYRVDRRTGTVGVYTTIAAGGDPHTPVNTISGPGEAPYFDDVGAFNAVGRVGLADLDLSDDEGTMYVINLNGNGSLEIINIGIPAAAAPLGQTSVGLPVPPGCTQANTRPGGLDFNDGALYVGLTCTGPTVADLRAYVYRFVGGAFSGPVADFPLNYTRGCASSNPPACADAEWIAWRTDTNGNPNDDLLTGLFGQRYAPQPWLLDIEFDEFGYMVLSVTDRAGHQLGNTQGLANSGPVEGVSAGDVLRLAPNTVTPGTWILENAGTAGIAGQPGASTSLAGATGQGPGGSEFYFGERYRLGAAGAGTHHETTVGGLAQIYGRGEIIAAAFDPAPQGDFRTGGVIGMSHATGERTRSGEIFPRDALASFGKAAGIGDVEGLCNFAPLEIGNRVWEDLDRNGRQDPGEAVLGGVRLSLYIDTDGDGTPETLVAETDTDGNGQYLFSARTIQNYLTANGITPVAGVHFLDINGDGIFNTIDQISVLPNSNFEVRIEAPANFAPGGPLENYFLTSTGADPLAAMRDSDGTNPTPAALASAVNFPRTRLRTGAFGNNNHTYDFGFSRVAPTTTTTTTTTTTGTGTTAGTTAGGTTAGTTTSGSTTSGAVANAATGAGGAPGTISTLSAEQIAKIPALPATGESPYAEARHYLMLTGLFLLAACFIGWLIYREREREIQ